MLNEELEGFLEKVLDRRSGPELRGLLVGYRLSAQSEGKSANTIALVEASTRYLCEFLNDHGLSTAINEIHAAELRGFIVALQNRQRFAHHPLTKPQEECLSGHTVNAYARSLRAFFSWTEVEGLIEENPFTRIRIPRAPKKIMPTFTEAQIISLMESVDTSTPEGFRNWSILLTLLDTGMRVSELTGFKVEDVNLEARLVKVLGKGCRERLVPIGSRTQKAFWRYLTLCRPEPATPRYKQFFLTKDGRPLTKDRVEAIVERCCRRAGITGVRASPHTFRHTFAVMFLRNGGDVFTLQRIMGHSTLDVLRIYVNMAQADINEAHRRCSPADNIDLKLPARKNRILSRGSSGAKRVLARSTNRLGVIDSETSPRRGPPEGLRGG
jgi:site-specific recombinase XerD